MDRAVGRRAVGRILEAGGLDDLFAGSGPDAPVLRAVLADLAGGRQGRWYATGARLARRRGLTVSYAVDRAAALWSVLQARERDDLYRALGVPPLAGAEALARRWREVVRTVHPGAGGDASRFRQARAAWDTLRDPERRSAYERWWLRALAPFATDQPDSVSAGGDGGVAPPDVASAVSSGAVSASRRATSTSGSVPEGAAERRARPSRSRVRAPRGLPCAR
jgi:hypothetical protein